MGAFEYLALAATVLGVVALILLLLAFGKNGHHSIDITGDGLRERLIRRKKRLRRTSVAILVGIGFVLAMGIYLLKAAEDFRPPVGPDQDWLSSRPEVVLVNVVSVRLGILIILIYATQMLFRVYRYQMLRADHYSAMLDSLALHSAQQVPMSEAMKICIPMVDIGRPPTLPIRDSMEVVRAAGSLKN